MNFKLENNEIKRWILKNGIYKMIDEDNQEILFKIKETDKTIIFELIGERPYLTLGDMDMFIYSLLLGGILGNLVDRILHGYVIDYISVIIGKSYFPVFNFADICIVLGVILMLWGTIKESLWKY